MTTAATEYFVPTRFLSSYVTDEQSFNSAAANYRRKVIETVDAYEAPKRTEIKRGDRGEKLVCHYHAETGELLFVEQH